MMTFIYTLTAITCLFGLGVCIWSEKMIREEQDAEEAND